MAKKNNACVWNIIEAGKMAPLVHELKKEK